MRRHLPGRIFGLPLVRVTYVYTNFAFVFVARRNINSRPPELRLDEVNLKVQIQDCETDQVVRWPAHQASPWYKGDFGRASKNTRDRVKNFHSIRPSFWPDVEILLDQSLSLKRSSSASAQVHQEERNPPHRRVHKVSKKEPYHGIGVHPPLVGRPGASGESESSRKTIDHNSTSHSADHGWGKGTRIKVWLENWIVKLLKI